MGLAIALVFLAMALLVHLIVYSVHRISPTLKAPLNLTIPRAPWKLGGIAQEMWRELTETLDFWAALLIAITGALFRAFGHSPNPEAFPILALIVSIAMSTIAQRMLSLDEGRASLRYRLLPVPGWKVLATQDAAFLITVGVLVSPLNLRAGCTCAMISLAVGRYPSLTRRVNQRRWRFVGGDPRFGIAQVVLGGGAGIAAARVGLWASLLTGALYAASLFWGGLLWKRNVTA